MSVCIMAAVQEFLDGCIYFSDCTYRPVYSNMDTLLDFLSRDIDGKTFSRRSEISLM